MTTNIQRVHFFLQAKVLVNDIPRSPYVNMAERSYGLISCLTVHIRVNKEAEKVSIRVVELRPDGS